MKWNAFNVFFAGSMVLLEYHYNHPIWFFCWCVLFVVDTIAIGFDIEAYEQERKNAVFR